MKVIVGYGSFLGVMVFEGVYGMNRSLKGEWGEKSIEGDGMGCEREKNSILCLGVWGWFDVLGRGDLICWEGMKGWSGWKGGCKVVEVVLEFWFYYIVIGV